MLSFEQIEEKYSVAHVRVCEEESLAGILRVAGRDTTIDLLSAKFFHLEKGENGWFDLEMMGPDGHKIFAHHALSAGTGNRYGPGTETTHFASVNPNILVVDSRGLDEDRRVSAVRFQVEGFENFFYYQHAEPLDSSHMSDEAKAVLLGMRYNPDEEKDFAAPEHVFIVHELQEAIDFRVEARRYRVWMGGSETFGWHKIGFRVYPTAEIFFDQPVTIDEALDRVWEWRRFFAQMAMNHLNFIGIGFRASHDPRATVGSVYLPNTERRKNNGRGPYDLHPAHLPLNGWGERNALAEAMRKWLEQNSSRRAFRARLDRVIQNMNRRMDQMDLIELSAGIDSLAELGGKEAFPAGAIDSMVEAARGAAANKNVIVEADRLRGILSQLQRRSLGEKMKELGRRAMPDHDFNDIELVVSTARKCRNDAAHRGAVSEQRQAQIGPVVEALASICIAFDLRGAGVPCKTSNVSSAFWSVRFRDAVYGLKAML